ncbi:related to inner mitochondrial membrane peptidase 2 [Ustilago bromivora]|uniref:Mitochondrial inner membrane protease subunit 2 n=1 Tax=Ustilago bromivora TaxID=307758 RepID=A0A1K0H4Y6_9BASI|nr:related to inner mitochondrial membrane peptidase 2 [Ustilago bromivora]SYW78610.1 related to inner mitochondrial membrane peptidase 2 [Ustilago bromivora]
MIRPAISARLSGPSITPVTRHWTPSRAGRLYSIDSTSTSTSSSASSSSEPSSSSTSSSSPTPSTSASTPLKYASFKADPSFRPTSSHPRQRSRLSRTLFTLGWIPVAAFISTYFYSVGNVTGGSMSPTFNGPYTTASASNSPSDVVLLNRTLTYNHNELRPGDIVTLISPLDPKLLLTKRIIALPEDTVRVWVPSTGGNGEKWARIEIPPGHVWVEGDAPVDIVPGSLERIANHPASSYSAPLRNKSRDSREFGPVPMGLITSRIEAILWPPRRFGYPASRPTDNAAKPGQYPPSTSVGKDRSTQVNPSLVRTLNEMTKLAPKSRVKAHPEDSVISPYVDWVDATLTNADEREDGVRVERGEDDERRKDTWNHLSRGGRLGDDAD